MKVSGLTISFFYLLSLSLIFFLHKGTQGNHSCTNHPDAPTLNNSPISSWRRKKNRTEKRNDSRSPNKRPFQEAPMTRKHVKMSPTPKPGCWVIGFDLRFLHSIHRRKRRIPPRTNQTHFTIMPANVCMPDVVLNFAHAIPLLPQEGL